MHTDAPFKKKLSWTAVLAGALVGLGINFLLDLLSLSIGFSLFTYSAQGKIIFSLGGFIGFILVGIVSMFMAGWTAGILSPVHSTNRLWGVLYGFVAWCLCLIFTTMLLMNMMQFASFHSNFTSQPDLIAIRIANDKPMVTETKTTRSAEIKAGEGFEKMTKTLTLNSYATFFLFLLGALSSLVGGFIGYSQQIIWRYKL